MALILLIFIKEHESRHMDGALGTNRIVQAFEILINDPMTSHFSSSILN